MDTKKLRQKVLDLAIHGKLVKQDPNDEPASILLDRIRAEKARLVTEGKIKKSDLIEKPIAEDEIPFEIPTTWEWVRLSQIGEIVTGSTPPKDNNSYYDGNIPFYKPTDLEQGINTITSRDSLSELGYSVSRQLPKDSILVTCIGATIGKTGLIRKRGTCNQQINAIIPNRLIFEEYIYYLCISSYTQFEIRNRASATTLPILNKNKFSEIPIPLPPLNEQHRIVKAVSELFEQIDIIEQSEKEINEASDKVRSKVLNLAIQGRLVPQDPNDEPASVLLDKIRKEKERLVKEGKLKKKDLEEKPISPDEIPFDIPEGWEWCRVSDICSFLSRGKSPNYLDTDKRFPVFAQKCNLKDGGISLDQARFLDPSSLKKWPEEYKLKTGDVLVNSTGTGTVGRTRLFNESCLGNYPFVVPDSHVSVVRSFDCIHSEYLYYLMNTKWIQTYFEDNLAGSTNQKELYIDVLGKTPVPLPPLAEQRRIVEKIEEVLSAVEKLHS